MSYKGKPAGARTGAPTTNPSSMTSPTNEEIFRQQEAERKSYEAKLENYLKTGKW